MTDKRKAGAKRMPIAETNVGQHMYKAGRADHYLEQDRARSKRNQSAKRDRLHEMKRESGCLICGEREPYVLEWHHDPRQPKLGTVSRLAYSGKWDDAIEEMKRCIVLCANCHRKITWGVIPDPFDS